MLLQCGMDMLSRPYVIAIWYGHVIASLCYCNV